MSLLTHLSNQTLPCSSATIQLGDNLPDARYATFQELINAYKAHSRSRGYGIRIGYSRANRNGKRTVLICDRSVKVQD
ncbi:hypothetical protein GcC1_194033 [Golovinomyces cichoracearum]|uniref:Uncharacterized protein n=1 Tax=Golovinomyces cichoracearum TaxID=62708 RepID=A0A420HH33_9PEZI|nr:hypothetical protein GcC1_194033 [Golovinomyces cichoracearum]